MKLLITGAWRHTEDQLSQIRQFGHDVLFLQNENEDLPCEYESVDGVICNSLFLYHPIEKFTNLKYIQLISAGFDRVPMEYVVSHNIVINNARGVYSIPMAEFALSSVLSVYKQTNFFRSSQVSHSWNKKRDLRELAGKRVCIIGCGSVGSECAVRFSAMGCDVIGIDAIPTPKKEFTLILSVDSLKATASMSDIIILTLPLTEETRGIIDRSVLENLSLGAVIVNISRGAIIDTSALIEVLSERSDITAVLDVFTEEPLSAENQLWDMENLLITPHNSFVGEGNADRLWSVIIDNIRNYNSK